MSHPIAATSTKVSAVKNMFNDIWSDRERSPNLLPVTAMLTVAYKTLLLITCVLPQCLENYINLCFRFTNPEGFSTPKSVTADVQDTCRTKLRQYLKLPQTRYAAPFSILHTKLMQLGAIHFIRPHIAMWGYTVALSKDMDLGCMLSLNCRIPEPHGSFKYGQASTAIDRQFLVWRVRAHVF